MRIRNWELVNNFSPARPPRSKMSTWKVNIIYGTLGDILHTRLLGDLGVQCKIWAQMLDISRNGGHFT